MDSSQNSNNDSSSVSVSVRPTPTLFWVKTKLEANSKSISGSVPNTLFGWIPIGKREIMSPMKQIAAISVNQDLQKPQLLIGTVVGLIAIFGGTGFVSSLLLLLVAAATLLSSVRVQLVITNTGGGKEGVTVSFLDKAALQVFVNGARQYMIDK
jgi:hypothetical protein